MTSPAEPRRDFIGYGKRPPAVVWPGGARLAVSFVVNYEEGSEYSLPDGDDRSETHGVSYSMPPGVRDLRVESTYEYGSRVGVWRLMRLFAEHDIKVTFFASAMAIERNPDVGTLIREEGHEAAGHGWRWIDAWKLSEEQERESIRRAITSLERTCGKRPVGWNTRGGPTVRTRRLLLEEGGFTYDSDATNDDLPYYDEIAGRRLLVIPYTRVLNDGRFANPPSYACASNYLDDCRRSIRYLWNEGARGGRLATIALHTRLIGEAARMDALRELIDYVRSLDGVWIARRSDIADWWAANMAAKIPGRQTTEA
jgi:peptidoglycan/xylan/chitin deacetylase (PgdA/CDA1 family)